MWCLSEGLMYGDHPSIVVEALLHSMRGTLDAGKELVTRSRAQPDTITSNDLLGVVQMTGASLDGASNALAEADAVVSTWLRGENTTCPATLPLLFERYFVEKTLDDPEGLSYLSLLESVGVRGHNRHLAQQPSDATDALHVTFSQRTLAFVDTLTSAGVPPEHKVSVGILKWMLQNEVEGHKWRHHHYALDQMDGIHAMLQMWMTDITPVKDLDDAHNYVARLRCFGPRFDLVCAEMALQRDLGIIPPKFTLEKVKASVDRLAKEASEEPRTSPLFTSCMERAGEAAPEAGPEALAALEAALEAALSSAVGPAYARLGAAVGELLAAAEAPGYADHAGVAALPEGAQYYAFRLATETSTSMSPEEVHELGHDQVKQILGAMEEVIGRLAAGDAALDPGRSVADNMRALAADPKWLYPDTEEGKAQCLAEFSALVQEIEAKIAPLFDIRPKQAMKVVRVPAHMEEGSPAAFYMAPAMDGSRDGVFYTNLGDMGAQFKYGMRTLTAHEAVPGHHFQLALQFEMRGLPFFRKAAESFNAFVEGWALYTEKLAGELGFYKTESDGSEGYDLLGHYGDELMRAARLVVDTGLHAKGWTKEQAMQYMQQATILAPSDIVTEVERYCVLPGQATSYKVGQLQILRLRDAMKAQQGDRFDPCLFHRRLLEAGAVPITMLEDILLFTPPAPPPPGPPPSEDGAPPMPGVGSMPFGFGPKRHFNGCPCCLPPPKKEKTDIAE